LIFQANMELGKFGTTRSAILHGLGAHWQSGYWPGQNEAVGIVPDGVAAVKVSSTVKVQVKRNAYSAYGDLGEIWDHPKLIWGPKRANKRIAGKRPRTRSRLPWGRAFVATSVDDRGRRKKPPITEPSDVRVSFGTSRGRHWIAWEANCNGSGGRVKARHGRLILSELAGTLIACPGPPALEDRWLDGLFEANPHWSLRGPQLRLWAGDRHMTLIEKT
jgi:META domain